MDKIAIGNRIKDIRMNNKIKKKATMEEFAKMVDSNKSNVSRWERGKNIPNEVTLRKIAELGETSVDELLYGRHKELINKKIDEIIELSKSEYSAEELDKINNNRDKIFRDNQVFFEYLIYTNNEESFNIIKSALRSFLFENKDINEKILSDSLYDLDRVRDELRSEVIDYYKNDYQKIERDYINGVYIYDTIEVFKKEVTESIYKQIDTTLKNAFNQINSLYEYHFEEKFEEVYWFKLRNSVLNSLSDEHFRRYSYYVKELLSSQSDIDGIDNILSTIVSNLESIKYDIDFDDLRNALVSFLDELKVPTQWEVPIQDLD